MKSISSISVVSVFSFFSLILGSIIFSMYNATNADPFLRMGYGYLVLMAVTSIVLCFVIYKSYKKNKANSKRYILPVTLLGLNIVMLVCYAIMIYLFINTMRMTFINATGYDLEHIEVVGCEHAIIDKIPANGHVRIWVDIPYDCSMTIKYTHANVEYQELVANSITTGHGQIMEYRIQGTRAIGE